MKIHHLNCATMCPALARLVNPERHMVCHCLLLETDSGLVLVDTGIGSQDVAEPRKLGRPFLAMTRPALDHDETALAQVQALGFQASDVRDIVLTHLDVDHAGGLPDFPDARVHVHAVELEAMRSPRGMEKQRYYPHHFAHDPAFVPHVADGEAWFGFESVRALEGSAEEVLIVPLVGHSRGHAGIAVKSGDGWLLHCGDAYFYRDEVDPDHPHCTLGLRLFQNLIQKDGRARRRNQRRLRELAAQHGDQVRLFCAHDPAELKALVGAAEVD